MIVCSHTSLELQIDDKLTFEALWSKMFCILNSLYTVVLYAPFKVLQ